MKQNVNELISEYKKLLDQDGDKHEIELEEEQELCSKVFNETVDEMNNLKTDSLSLDEVIKLLVEEAVYNAVGFTYDYAYMKGYKAGSEKQ